ncbi:DUF2441 domain-containing protein [Variovorax sp. W2I14]|uniref:DUF2441 domain-containing protein n=1 Tax=Variovorax sp. W2I14 TaxID=3042290 RepID=UPI003D1F390A
MQYFHVDSGYPPANKQLLRVGDTISTSSLSCNPFYEAVTQNIHKGIGYYRPPLRLLEWLRSSEPKEVPPEVLHKDMHAVLQASTQLIREMEFENVRRAEFADLPSRTRGIWLSDNLVQAKFWQHRVEKSGLIQIVCVEIDGAIHRADGGHLPFDTSSILELRESAKRYWRGMPHPDQETEYLLEGRMSVVGIVG